MTEKRMESFSELFRRLLATRGAVVTSPPGWLESLPPIVRLRLQCALTAGKHRIEENRRMPPGTVVVYEPGWRGE